MASFVNGNENNGLQAKENKNTSNNANNNHHNKTAWPSPGQKAKLVASSEDPKQLIPELCRHFYNLGWASGE